MGKNDASHIEKYQFKPAGDPRSDEARRKAGETVKRQTELKHDIRLLSEELIKQLMLPLVEGEIKNTDDINSLEELVDENTNKTVAQGGISKLAKRFAEGDKRSVTQIVEILSAVSDAREADHNDGFIEALGNNAGDDWKDE